MKMHNAVSRLRNACSKVVAGAAVALTSASAFAGELSDAVTSGVDKTELTAIGAVVLGMVYEYLPFMILPIYTVMSKIDKGLIEAAQYLGSNGFHVFSKVVLPLSIPGVISGITLVFVPSASTFLVAQYLGGTNDIMIGDIIDKVFWTDQSTGSAISLILMVFILVFLVLMNFFGDEEAIA